MDVGVPYEGSPGALPDEVRSVRVHCRPCHRRHGGALLAGPPEGGDVDPVARGAGGRGAGGHPRARGRPLSAVRELADLPAILASQRRPRHELDRRLLAGMRAIVAHAHATVPYYAADARYDPVTLNDLDAVANLPALRKADVLEAGSSRL